MKPDLQKVKTWELSYREHKGYLICFKKLKRSLKLWERNMSIKMTRRYEEETNITYTNIMKRLVLKCNAYIRLRQCEN